MRLLLLSPVRVLACPLRSTNRTRAPPRCPPSCTLSGDRQRVRSCLLAGATLGTTAGAQMCSARAPPRAPRVCGPMQVAAAVGRWSAAPPPATTGSPGLTAPFGPLPPRCRSDYQVPDRQNTQPVGLYTPIEDTSNDAEVESLKQLLGGAALNLGGTAAFPAAPFASRAPSCPAHERASEPGCVRGGRAFDWRGAVSQMFAGQGIKGNKGMDSVLSVVTDPGPNGTEEEVRATWQPCRAPRMSRHSRCDSQPAQSVATGRRRPGAPFLDGDGRTGCRTHSHSLLAIARAPASDLPWCLASLVPPWLTTPRARLSPVRVPAR